MVAKVVNGSKGRLILQAVAFAGMCLVAPAVTRASTIISINNFSFETPNVASFSTTCPTSWTCVGAFNGGLGVYAPVSTQYPPGADGLPSGNKVPDGTQAAYFYGVGTLSQTTSAFIADNTTYLLDVWAGLRNDQTTFPNVSIALLANGVQVASSVLTSPGQGKWAEYTLTYTTGSGAGNPQLGQSLGLALIDNTNAGSTQINFDLITLQSFDAGGIDGPEPATGWLLGILFGVAFVTRRRLLGKASA